jgi:hypothetical protein
LLTPFNPARELRRALANLRNRARRRLQGLRPQRLDRVDDRDVRPRGFERTEHALELRFRRDAHPFGLQPQPPRTQRDLVDRFFAGEIEHRGIRHRAQRLQQQRGLADSRIAAQQCHLPRHQPAAERAVELADSGRQPLEVPGLYLGQRHRCGRYADAPHAAALGSRFRQGAGGTTGGTSAEPLQRGGAALGADVGGLRFRHQATSATGTRAVSLQRSS